MYFEPNEDQSAFLSVLEQMTASAEAGWQAAGDWRRFDWSSSFDGTLQDNGFYDCAREETLGAVAAAALVFRLNGLPITVEAAASSLLLPYLGRDLPRPIAVVEGNTDIPIRFLPVARSLLHLGNEGVVRSTVLANGSIEPVESLFAYPMGKLTSASPEWTAVSADAQAIRDRWRVALAAEIGGSLKGGLESVLAHVRDRRQFGRPLGSFQTIQHRLAEAAVRIEASYLMTLKAAQTADPVDAAAAIGYAQDAATSVVYDFHQFMGATGLTLEHPLHRWTYRAKFLRSSLGGALDNHALVSERRWGNR